MCANVFFLSNINKLQLEGLVKAGCFDEIEENRQSLYNSIPSLILKSKNIFENKIANQINLFEDKNDNEDTFIEKTDDWMFEERLSKEFQSVGFFISDHPLNQFKEIFDRDPFFPELFEVMSENRVQAHKITGVFFPGTLPDICDPKSDIGSF